MSIQTNESDKKPITSSQDSSKFVFDSKSKQQAEKTEQEKNFMSQLVEITNEFGVNPSIYNYKQPKDENMELFNIAKTGNYEKFVQRYNEIFKATRVDQYPTLKSISNILKYEPIKDDYLEDVKGKPPLEKFIKLQLWQVGALLAIWVNDITPPPCVNKEVNAAVLKGNAADFKVGIKSYISKWKDINPMDLKEQLDVLEQHFQDRLSVSYSPIPWKEYPIKLTNDRSAPLRESKRLQVESRVLNQTLTAGGEKLTEEQKGRIRKDIERNKIKIENFKKDVENITKKMELIKYASILNKSELRKIISYLNDEKHHLQRELFVKYDR